MEAKFNNDLFDFYRSGVMVVERLENYVSSCVRVFTHELFNQSFKISICCNTDDKIEVKDIMAIFTFSVQKLWFLKD